MNLIHRLKVPPKPYYLLAFFILLGVIFLPLATYFGTKQADAAINFGFTYTNSNYSTLSGPLPNANGTLSGVIVTYTNKTGGFGKGNYGHILTQTDYNQFPGLGGCQYIQITTDDNKYDGDTSAKISIQNTGCSGNSNSESITITNPYKKQTTTGGGTVTASQLISNLCNQTLTGISAGGSGCISGAQSQCNQYASSFNAKNSNNPFSACVVGFVDNYRNEASSASDACDTGAFSSSNQTICETAYNSENQGAGSNTPSCEQDGFALNWIMCPIITGIADGANSLYSGLIQPLLVYKPVDLTSGKQTYQVWSSFRVYADIFLVLVLLIIVYSEAAGGGLIDTYSARKILPRLLAAAILINLSIYIVAFAVDVFNVLGNGLTNLLEEPFKAVHGFNLNFSAGFNYLAEFGTAAGAASIWALSLHKAGGAHLALPILKFIIFSVIIPAAFILLAITATVIIRRGLILLLVLISPVAFVLYALPNTEQYFRRWWDLLMRTLLVYPIISVAFAMGSILSVTLGDTVSGVDQVIANLLSVVALFAPLAFIPFSFRIAGGILGRAYEGINNVTRGVDKALFDERREIAKRDVGERATQGRGAIYRRMNEAASKSGKGPLRALRNRALKTGAGIVGGYNIMAAESAIQAQTTKEMQDTISNGDDTEIRALSVDKKHAMALGQGVGWKWGDNGERLYKTLGGKWVNEASVDAAHDRWGNNAFALQSALSYEMTKTDSRTDIDFLKDNYGAVAKGHGLTDGQAGGAWIGGAFNNQNTNLEYKYTNWQTGQIDSDDKRRAFLSEIYNKRGSYNMAQMHGSTIRQLRQINLDARRRLAANPTDADAIDMTNKTAAIAESFVSRYGAGGRQIGTTGEENVQPQFNAEGQQVAGQPVVQTMTPGSEYTAEEVRRLAVETGRYQELPPDSSQANARRRGTPRIRLGN